MTPSRSKQINQEKALSAIRKKLIGKTLNYKEIYSIMDEISHQRLGDVLTTYFAASGYSKGFTNQELYFLTKAMVETGEKLHFNRIVADKHSIGGVPGTRTTLVVVPIVAAAGFIMPKSSSRSITTPSGTADVMEVLAPVILSKEKIYSIVKKTKGCIVWGGSFNIAPADDVIIKVEKPLLFESYDKILVSIMAKKIAFGSNHVVIDLPYGKMVKVSTISDAKIIKEKFEYLARMFKIKIRVLIHKTDQPAGQGIGPIFEAKDALKVLEQSPDRPVDLEIRSINLAGNLLEICLSDSSQRLKDYVKKNYGNCFGWATSILRNKFALAKMKEIIKGQGGNPHVTSGKLKPGKFSFKATAGKNQKVVGINSKNLTIVARVLGAPQQKGAGIFLNKKIDESVKKGEVLYAIYSDNMYNLKEGKDTISHFPFLMTG